jgi:hypothetical protein
VTYTATPVSTRSILLDVSDTTTLVVCGTVRGTPDQRTVGGEVRQYASGRTRAVTFGSVTRSEQLTLVALTEAQHLLVVETWPGRTLLLRDTFGLRMFGTYLDTAVSRWKGTQGLRYDVQVTFQQVTYTETV